MKIDLVYAWVDGSDPQWQRKRANYHSATVHPNATATGRTVDNDELRFSLRSAEQYAPWINHIFIVTDNQTPAWLNIHHPRISIVDHRDIVDHAYLPTFNSNVFEWFLHRIKGLSEYYLYANDDTFFGNHTQPHHFFDPDGLPIECVMRYVTPNGNTLYDKALQNAHTCFTHKTGQNLPFSPGHMIDPYRKSFVSEAVDVFGTELEQTWPNRFRSETDIQRTLISLYDHHGKRRKLVYGDRRWTERIFRQFRYVNLLYPRGIHLLKRLQSKRYRLFCINDTANTTDELRHQAKLFLERYFPLKSHFEK
ncbi:MAG: stealth family protein [Burkholderiaceae bacterium]|jgi:hypothetical protein|nr:stealth family protein [Burkholderiaceae bacterium]